MSIIDSVQVFLTISMDCDYNPSQGVLDLLKRSFDDYIAVTEIGEIGGKLHFHACGCLKSGRRKDNFIKALKVKLEKEGYDLTKYSIDCALEARYNWRLGYLLKSPKEILHTTYSDAVMAQYKELYMQNQKRQRLEKEESTMTKSKLVQMCQDNCKDEHDLRRYLATLIRNREMSFAFYEKLNLRKLCEYLFEEINLN